MNHESNTNDVSHTTDDTPKEFISISEYIEKEIRNSHSTKNMYHKELSETNVLFVGEENAGKTSLINLCLGHKGKTDKPKLSLTIQ